MLFGPVSISNAYRPASRALMVSFLERSSSCPELAGLGKARSPFRGRWLKNLVELEEGGKGVPVLLRQYLKMGGRLLAFNVDARFSNALDGLIAVDLLRTDPRVLERYMGKEGLSRFLAWHSAPPRPQ